MILSKLSGLRDQIKDPRVFMSDFGLFLVLAALFIYFSIASPHFLNYQNFINILIAVSVIGIISTAMTLVIIGRGPDLTVGAVVAAAGCIQAYLVLINGFPWWIGILGSLAVGLTVGFINGIVIEKFNLPPFIVTLAMMNIVRGLAFVMVDGMAHFVNVPQLVFLGRFRLFVDTPAQLGLNFGAAWRGIPLLIFVLIIAFVLFDFISKKTVFGRQVYASGGNRTAARLAGINVGRITVILFVLSGFMSSIAGIALVGIGGAALPSIGEAYPLDAITAVLLGGTSLAGGVGSVRRTLIGVLIIGIINNGMALMNVQTFWQLAARGAILLAAIILDSMQHRAKN